MRNRARLGVADANQPLIVKALQQAGASVQSTSMVGDGFPDLVVAFRGNTFLFEIKTDTGKLNAEQVRFHVEWRGPIHIIRQSADALAVIHGTRLYVSDTCTPIPDSTRHFEN